GLAAHIDDARPLLQQALGVRKRGLGRIMLAAVGEGVGRDVEDAHHNGHPRIELIACAAPDHRAAPPFSPSRPSSPGEGFPAGTTGAPVGGGGTSASAPSAAFRYGPFGSWSPGSTGSSFQLGSANCSSRARAEASSASLRAIISSSCLRFSSHSL